MRKWKLGMLIIVLFLGACATWPAPAQALDVQFVWMSGVVDDAHPPAVMYHVEVQDLVLLYSAGADTTNAPEETWVEVATVTERTWGPISVESGEWWRVRVKGEAANGEVGLPSYPSEPVDRRAPGRPLVPAIIAIP